MRLIRDNDHVAARGERLRNLSELLQGREDHAARCPAQDLLQIVAALGLHRRLPDQIAAHREGREELVVEIVPVGQHHQRWVGHRRMFDQLPGIERHQQAFTGALGVPDDAHPLIALRRGRSHRAVDRVSHRVELVVARDDLGQPGTGFAEDREVTEQIEQAAMLEHALNQCRKFRRTFRGNVRAVGGAPRHEALKVCRQ